jgi:hypothetical protein
MEYWWNNNWQGKPKCLEKILLQCHFVPHKSHMIYPGTECWPHNEEKLHCLEGCLSGICILVRQFRPKKSEVEEEWKKLHGEQFHIVYF